MVITVGLHFDLCSTVGSYDPGWTKCYWCGWWEYGDIYIIDWIGEHLCDRCFYYHIETDGGPYQPDAITRAASYIEMLLRFPVPHNVSRLMAEFLHEWKEP